jgi:kynurenine 3-monooxygenase
MRQVKSPEIGDLLGSVLEETIPMHGRMIHGRDSKGELYGEGQAYDINGNVQTSILFQST